MPVGEQLGRAYITVHADTAPFNQELQRDLGQAQGSFGPGYQAIGRKIGQQTARGVSRGMREQTKKEAPTLIREIGRIWEQEASGSRGLPLYRSGRAIARTINAGIRRTFVGSIGRDISRSISREIDSNRTPILSSVRVLARSMRSVFSHTIGSGFGLFGKGGAIGGRGGSGGGGILASIGASIGNVGARGPIAPILGALIAYAIPALIGLVLGLAKALSGLLNVVALIPGALAITVTSIVPLVLGFQGIGDALKAIASHDPKVIAEAFKELTPSARTFIRSLEDMLPLLTNIRKAAQEGLFGELAKRTGDLKPANATQRAIGNLSPIFEQGSGKVAAAWGRAINAFFTMISSAKSQQFFTMLFDATAKFIDAFSPGFVHTFEGLLALIQASLPTFEKIGDKLGRILTDFGDWLIVNAENGNVQKWLDKFFDALELLWNILTGGKDFIQSLLGSIAPEDVESMFDSLKLGFDGMMEFFKSDVGQQGLKGMVTLAGSLAVIVGSILAAFTTMVAVVQSLYDILLAIVRIINPFHAFDQVVAPVSNIARKAIELQNQKRGGSAIPPGGGGKPRAHGTITAGPEVALIGEAGPEAVIPLTDRNRAMELMERSGLSRLATAEGATVYVFIGNEQLDSRMYRVAEMSQRSQAAAMQRGPRTVGF